MKRMIRFLAMCICACMLLAIAPAAFAAEGSYTATGAEKSTELTVWINRSVPYVQVLQQKALAH